LPYLNTLRNGFVSDDGMQVLQNPFIHDLHYLGRIFTTQATSYIPEMPNFYRPLMNVGYLFCYQVFGPHAWGFHLTNIVVNALVVAALFLLTNRMFQDRNLALMTTVLFAVHPIHSEAVAWVGAIPDLELTFFYMLTFWLFLDAARPGGRDSYWAQLGLAGSFLLTIFSKEQAVTLPVLATVYEHFYRADRKETTPAQKAQRYGVLWFLTVAYLLFRILVLGGLSSGSSLQLSWFGILTSAGALLGQYLGEFLWPVDLRVFCPFHAPLSLFDPPVIGGLAALAACTGVFVYLWRRAKPLSFGLVWMLLTLAPVLNARWMPAAAFEERYLYLPSVGLCWVVGWAFLRLWVQASARGAAWRRAFAAAFGILVALCGLRIVTRNRDWRDNFTLYTKTLSFCPDAYYVRRDLGSEYWQKEDLESAEREWRETLQTAPRYSLAYSSLGLLELKRQRYPEAIEFFKKALELNPRNASARLYLGVSYMDTHMLQLAEPELRTAVSAYAFDANARNALGKFYLEEGRAAEAEQQFLRSVEIEPNIMGYSNLGVIYWQRGDTELAEKEWREALRLAPNSASLLSDLGLVSTRRGHYAEAASYFRQAIRLKPDDPSPHSNLGLAFQKSGQPQAAEAEFRAALALAPQKFETRNRLGTLLLEAGRVEEAEEQFRLSLKTQPNPSAYFGLGEVDRRRGNWGGAERAFQSAVSLDAGDSQAHFKLAGLYESQGRKEEALKEYQAGLKSDPGNSEAQAAVQKLSAQGGGK
jgi:tetratricopeptide (TPR) repeat protein